MRSLFAALCGLSWSAMAAAPATVLIEGDPASTRAITASLEQSFEVRPLKSAAGRSVKTICLDEAATAIVQARGLKGLYTVTVLNCADEALLETQTFKPPKKFTAMPASVTTAVALALGKCAPAAAEVKPVAVAVEAPKPQPAAPAAVAATPVAPVSQPAPVAEPAPPPAAPAATPETSTAAPAEAPATLTRPTLRASVGLRGFNRTFNVSGDPGQTVGTYSKDFHGGVRAEGQFYPLAGFTQSFAANIGVYGQSDFGVGVNATPFGTTTRFSGQALLVRTGLMVRVPFSAAELNVHVGYATQSFAIAPLATDGVTLRPNLPSVTFNGVRAGLGTRVAFNSTFGFEATAGFTSVMRLGEIASAAFFPKATALAFDGAAGLTLKLTDGLEARVMADYTHYLLSLNPQSGGAFSATGATDQYLGITAALGWSL